MIGKTRFRKSMVLANGFGVIEEDGTEGKHGVVQTMTIDVPDAATGNVDTVLDRDLTVLDVFLVVGGTNGANDNTIQVRNGTTNAVTDAMSMINKSASDVVRATELVQARTAFEAGDTLRVVRTRAGGDASCKVFVQFVM